MKARDNPFRSERVERLAYRAKGFAWESLDLRLTKTRGRGAIVGPRGHGKTTLLFEWMERCESPNTLLIRVSEGQRRLATDQVRALRQGSHIFVDNAEQLGWWGRRELIWRSRLARLLIVTTHRPGFLPTVFTCRSSPQLLAELAGELTPANPETEALWRQHQGDIRLAFRELYDRCANRSGHGDSHPRAI